MSETEEVKTEAPEAAPSGDLQLDGLFAFKVGMSAVFSDEGERIPVTVLRYEQMIVSQVKTAATDGYEALQVAFVPDRASQTNTAAKKHLTKTGFENGAKHVREVRLEKALEGAAVGQKISIDSLKKGDMVKVSGESRG